jgi:hypothetical protein
MPEEATYASVADVQALAPTRKLGQGSNPTSEDVQIYLALTEAEINSILVNKGYAVPVSKEEAPQAFQLMRTINAQGAVAQLEASGGNGPNIKRTEGVYQASLKSLSEAREVMDAAQDVERDKPRGPGVTTVEPSPGNEPFFTRNEETMQF